jgi:hypothetical protein
VVPREGRRLIGMAGQGGHWTFSRIGGHPGPGAALPGAGELSRRMDRSW